MTQKLSDLIQRSTYVRFPAIKTKAHVRREAAMKAARTRKRLKMAREAAKAKSEAA